MTWEEIDYVVLDSPAASITVTVPTPYDFFRISIYIMNDGNAGACNLTFNADTGANYAKQRISANGTSIVGGRVTGQTAINISGLNLSANDPFNGVVIVAKPAAGVKAQTIAQTSLEDAANIVMDLNGGEWNNTAAEVTSITLTKSSGNFASGYVLVEGMNA